MQTDEKTRRTAFKRQVRRDRKRFGVVVRGATADGDHSQADIAAKLGWRPNKLSEVVNGRRKTELSELALIAGAVNTDLITLVRRFRDR